jgi:hypothetical protein
MNDVVERLERLSVGGASGDWVDVVQRAGRQRAAATRRRLLIAVAAAAILAVPTLALAQRISDALVVAPDETEVDVPWVSGNDVHNLGGEKRRLEEPVWLASSYGYDLARAIPSPDGRHLVYHALKTPEPRPTYATTVLRSVDLENGKERVIGKGITSAAWRADGVLGYSRGSDARRPDAICCGFDDVELGHVYVRETPESVPVRWTRRPSNYEVFAWARDELLIGARVANEGTVRERFGQPQEEPGVYAVNGAGRLRTLPLAAITAVDPTGRYAIGPTGIDLHLPVLATLRVVRINDGRILDEFALAPLATPDQPYAVPSAVSGGSWAAEYIAVGYSGGRPPEATATRESDDVIVVLRFDGKLEPVHVFRLEPESARRAGLAEPRGYPATLYSPRFADAEGRKIVALGTAAQRSQPALRGAPGESAVLLLCDRVEKTCRRSEELRADQFGIGFVENPSRPMPES